MTIRPKRHILILQRQTFNLINSKMRKQNKTRMVSVRLLLLMIFGISITSWAAESDKVVSVTCQGSTFTITRSDASAATYINYRTLDGSAVGGKNFTPQAGRLYFNKGEFSKSIEIKEIDPGESIFAF